MVNKKNFGRFWVLSKKFQGVFDLKIMILVYQNHLKTFNFILFCYYHFSKNLINILLINLCLNLIFIYKYHFCFCLICCYGVWAATCLHILYFLNQPVQLDSRADFLKKPGLICLVVKFYIGVRLNLTLQPLFNYIQISTIRVILIFYIFI